MAQRLDKPDAEDALNSVKACLNGLEQFGTYMEEADSGLSTTATIIYNSVTQGLNELAVVEEFLGMKEKKFDHYPIDGAAEIHSIKDCGKYLEIVTRDGRVFHAEQK